MRTKILLILALGLLFALAIYLYQYTYIPSLNQANAMRTQIESQR